MATPRITQELRNLAEKSLPHGKTEKSRRAVEIFMQQGELQIPPNTTTIYNPATLWEDGIDRSLARYLHGLLFLRDWPASIKLDETGRTARTAVTIALDWYAKFPKYESCNHSMAFHDETTAQRLITLLAILESSIQYINNHQTTLLSKIIEETSDLLLDDDFHSTGNNHGMFQDIALRTYASINDMSNSNIEGKLSKSIRRLNDYFSSSFTSEGVHRENSPTYHLMITKHLAEHSKYLSLLDTEVDKGTTRKLLERAAEYATHAILPTGVFLPLSDTQQTAISGAHHNVFGSTEFEYASSAGKNGTVPAKKILSLPKSGYFYARDKWGSLNSTFVSFVAAYNDNYHKHSDDLSLFVWHNGRELLSEAGPYGYNYQLPLTKYGFSQYAHNNIIVDGASTPRTDSKARSVWMQAAVENASGVTVTAGTGRLKDTYHQRKVSIAHNFKRIEVEDQIQSLNNNKYECLWNLGTDVNVVTHGDGFELFYGKTKVADAYIETSVPVKITVHRGQMKPKPLGWHFPKFGESKATNTVLVSLNGADVSIKTTFNFSDFKYPKINIANVPQSRNSLTGPPVKYFLEKKQENNKRLFIFFSDTLNEGPVSDTLIKRLRNIDANKLYIYDDFGDKGCYYWLQQGRETVYDSVQQLILSVMKDLDIEDPNYVATFGCSTGGTAAVLHGAGIKAGVAFVGTPQLAIGSFLEEEYPETLHYMSRGRTLAHANSLDARLLKKLDSFERLPRIHHITDSREAVRYANSVALENYTKNREQVSEMLVCDTADVSAADKYEYLLPRIVEDHSDDRFESLRQYDVDLSSTETSLNMILNNSHKSTFSLKLYKGSNLVNTIPYSKTNKFEWSPLSPGRYRVRVYERTEGERMLPFTTPWIVVGK